MAEYIVQGESLTAIADEIRELSGTTATMGLDAMADNVSEANEEVSNQVDLIAQITSALEGKVSGGQATPEISINSTGLITATAGTKSSTKQLTTQSAKTITPTKSSQTAVSSGVYTTGTITVAAIPGEYITTTDATAEANEIMSGETAYVNGSKVTGSFTLESEITTQDNLIAQIQSALNGKASGGGVLPELTNPATSENLEEGYELIDGDGNIIVGTHVCESGGGEIDHSLEDGLLMGTLTEYSNDRVEVIKSYAFYEDTSITSVSFLNCESIGAYAFSVSSLETANFPACVDIYESAFSDCVNLTTINLPACTTIGAYAFAYTALETISLPVCQSMFMPFNYCENLTSIYLGSNDIEESNINSLYMGFSGCINLTNLTLYYPFVVPLDDISAFEMTPMIDSSLTGSFGSIYVPASLVDEYKAADVWSELADRITAIPE